MNNLTQRTLTGVLYVAALVGCTLLGPLPFVALFSLITVLAVWEFTGLVNRHAGAQVNRFVTTAAGLLLYLTLTGYVTQVFTANDFGVYLLTLLYLLVSELYRREPSPVQNWAYALCAQLYIALPFALLSALAFSYNAFAGTVDYTPILPLAVFIFLWTNDTGAYLTGSALHKRFPARLFPRISPNKSWVGSLGGGVLCLGAAVALWHFNRDVMPLPLWLAMGLTVCVFGTWGDLVESLLKRTFGIKDSGTLLPGHGGMLDRFDSALLAIPAALLLLLLFL